MKPVITFFNNKGGVGKTTLACNFAHRMASHWMLNGKCMKVLVIDMDPQANATQLLIDNETWESIYTDVEKSFQQTVMHVFDKILDGEAPIKSDIYIHKSERFKVDVLAGHPTLSIIEDEMAKAWGEMQPKANMGPIYKSNWLNFLNVELSDKYNYDVIIIDAGPSLGALNRSILLGSTHFVTPLAPDLFSLYSLKNIGGWISEWGGEYKRLIELISENETPAARLSKKYSNGTFNSDLKYIDIIKDVSIMKGYVGYTIQQYVTRSGGNNTRRKTKAYEEYIARIPDMSEQLKKYSLYSDNLSLGIVPQMFAMIPLAQSSRAPISTLTGKDGLNGSQFAQQENYTNELENIFDKIVKRVLQSEGEEK